MRPVEFYFYLGVILALPPIVVLVMLVRSAGAVVSGDTRLAEQQRVRLRLLLTQALVPPLQVLPLLRSATSAPSRAATVGTSASSCRLAAPRRLLNVLHSALQSRRRTFPLTNAEPTGLHLHGRAVHCSRSDGLTATLIDWRTRTNGILGNFESGGSSKD